MIRIVEVGPRDGLQNEKANISTADKIAFVDLLSAAGAQEIEVSAFVSPQWVPQLADAEDVFSGITRRPGITYSALVPNERGLERAMAAGAAKVAVFTAASNTFNKKNQNTDTAGTFARLTPVVKLARSCQLPVRGYISTAFWCPYEGPMHPSACLKVAEALRDCGAEEVSIGDTIGKATASEVEMLLAYILPHLDVATLALHFHDTFGRAAMNVIAAYKAGIRTFDASVAGLGGCPYAPGAAGNVSTEQVVQALQTLNVATSIDLKALERAREFIAARIGRTL